MVQIKLFVAFILAAAAVALPAVALPVPVTPPPPRRPRPPPPPTSPPSPQPPKPVAIKPDIQAKMTISATPTRNNAGDLHKVSHHDGLPLPVHGTDEVYHMHALLPKRPTPVVIKPESKHKVTTDMNVVPSVHERPSLPHTGSPPQPLKPVAIKSDIQAKMTTPATPNIAGDLHKFSHVLPSFSTPDEVYHVLLPKHLKPVDTIKPESKYKVTADMNVVPSVHDGGYDLDHIGPTIMNPYKEGTTHTVYDVDELDNKKLYTDDGDWHDVKYLPVP